MYRTVWRFTVKPGNENEFVRQYSPDGSWAALFRRADGWVRTELFQSTSEPDVFLTVDIWQTREAFLRFRADQAAEYEQLDDRTASLTSAEEHLAGSD